MKAVEVLNKLKSKIPISETWSPCTGESYGGYYMEPNKEVKKVLYCVTAEKRVQEYFLKNGYDILISHHPIHVIMSGIPQIILHTALDCCKDGLNDYWKNFLKVKNPRHFDANLGWYGEIESISYDNLCDKIETELGCKMIGSRLKKINTVNSVVICTGLGGMVNESALKTNCDCYILGQCTSPIEGTGFRSVIEIGHTLSERNGYDFIKKILGSEVQIDIVPLEKDVCVYGEKFE